MSDEPTPWDGQPYSIKRHGVTITNCDSEPVQTPGCVQDHGALIVLNPNDLVVVQVSENSERLLGRAPATLLTHPVRELLGAGGENALRELLAGPSLEGNPLHLLTFDGPAGPLDVSAHTSAGALLLEFEPAGPPRERDDFALVRQAITRLHSATRMQAFLDTVCEEVQSLIGLDRVMVYRFHPDQHGEVVAEVARPGLELWHGLHYPAEDIPAPAREIFRRIWARPVPDVNGGLAELVPLTNPDTGQPLTMTHCSLRGASVMYTEYLQNMRVTAAFTMSMRKNGDLWGLIACHHYSGTKHVPYRVRTACELLAQVVSLRLRAIEDREALIHRLELQGVHEQLVAGAAKTGDLATMFDGPVSLLTAMQAQGAALRHGGRWWRIGRTPDEPALEALAGWLFARPEFAPAGGALYSTDSLARDCPDNAKPSAGLLAFPLSRARRSLMMWFRDETVQTVKWAGNPQDKPTVTGPHGPRLTPRRSFELFVESVRGRSAPWTPVELEAAARLRTLVLELVVGRSEVLAELNSELTRSNEELDAFAHVASHDLKEPLRGIYKYAHQLRDEAETGTEDQRTKLDRLIWLTMRMETLLDSLLSYARGGRAALVWEDVDVDEVVAEAREMVDSRSSGAGEIVVPRPLPHAQGDRMRVREVLVNLFSNALKYNARADKRIEVGYVSPGEDLPPGCPPEARGDTIFYVRDNGIGIAPKHHGEVFKIFKRLHGTGEYGGGSGVGLTIVKKLIERQNGQLWLDSQVDHGSTFYFTLPGREEA